MDANEHIETITAVQTEGDLWIPAIDGMKLGDTRPQETAADCIAWARKFFGPNFKYEEA